ncbi:Peptidyl-prolyl cis-trans isomerase D [Shewanella putrefaciens]|uniref:SurA N-terminal domain-containing protein n=1 Tax=Shewanella putrefaciens TaxID=24 RepID=UPI000DF9BEED|nr:SurA N-terminal domain-containing protein [Shewanella putrefaciens]SUI60173.1 Peptidyl-prolyl cis-trans isomerase D [Shewanella putrefaciens]
MLEKIRDGSQGVIAKSILVLVILSFAFAGVSSYLGSTTDVPAAEVNGDKITKAELEQAYQSERSRMEQQLGEMFAALSADERYLESIKQSVLERLVADKLIDQAASTMGLRVSDEQIITAIKLEPAFQTDGKFDNERYQAILRQLGYQPQSFRNMMRVDMTRRQLTAALVGTEFVLPSEAKQLAELQGQTRDIRYLVVDSAPFLANATVTDEQVKNYYDANQGQFMSPEQVSLEYVELNAADFAKNSPVTDEEAQAYYDEHKTQYLANEKRLAAHILINADQDDAATKAADLAKQLDNGADFAELAKAHSDDRLSAEQGGKLEWFEPGVMEPTFDAALFALNKGEHSAVVKTGFGYHIIKLLDVQAGATVPFADVKAKIVAQLQDKKAVDQFYSLQSKLADTSYEVPDTLAETAKVLGVSIKTTPLFSRDDAPEGLNKPDLVKAAFSDTVKLKGLNSEVIELEPNHVVVIRVKEHHDAGTLALAEVKANITERLKQDQANEAARAKAQELMTQVNAAATDLDLVSKVKLGRGEQNVDAAIVGKAFQMPTPSSTPVVDIVGLANGYAVIALDKVNAAEGVSDELVNALKQRLNAQYSEADYRGLIDSLKANAKVVYSAE